MSFLTYLFWPNPGGTTYDNPKVIALIAGSLVLIFGSFLIGRWRRSLANPVTKKLSRSWSSASVWFGIVALVLTISRVEQISYLSMRLLWVVWAFFLLAFLSVQVRQFRARHYEAVRVVRPSDPRDEYLPGKKKRH